MGLGQKKMDGRGKLDVLYEVKYKRGKTKTGGKRRKYIAAHKLTSWRKKVDERKKWDEGRRNGMKEEEMG